MGVSRPCQDYGRPNNLRAKARKHQNKAAMCMKIRGEFQKNVETFRWDILLRRRPTGPSLSRWPQRAMLFKPSHGAEVEKATQAVMLKCKNEATKLLKIKGWSNDLHRKRTHLRAKRTHVPGRLRPPRLGR